MIATIQRISEASITINGNIHCSVKKGLLVLIGITHADTNEDVNWLVKKIIQMRIFSDEEGKMNLSLQDVAGDLLIVSQFTLHASTKKGNRPSFIEAARPEQAIPLYNYFVEECKRELGKEVATGIFGADMKVALVNDGPVTILIDSQNKR